MATYKQVQNPPPITTPLPPYHGFSFTSGGVTTGTSQAGGFTVAQYAAWAALSLTDAQTVLDAAVANGTLVLS